MKLINFWVNILLSFKAAMGRIHSKWTLTLLPLLCLSTKQAKAATTSPEVSIPDDNVLNDVQIPDALADTSTITASPIQPETEQSLAFAPHQTQTGQIVESFTPISPSPVPDIEAPIPDTEAIDIGEPSESDGVPSAHESVDINVKTEEQSSATIHVDPISDLQPEIEPSSVDEPSFPRFTNTAETQIAQIIPTDDATQTQVTTEGNVIEITGGTQTEHNLFHRFETFNVESGQVADFVTTPEVQSVVGQVAGGDPSHINGIIQSTGSTADIYLINPSGIIFGAEAQLNVGGSFTASTADQVEFGEATLDVVSTQNYQDFVASPDTHIFTTTDPGSIINQGDLTVAPGESIQLIGGEVVNTGTLTAPGGEISLIAVPGGNLVRLGNDNSLLSVELDATQLQANPTAPSLPELLTGGNISEVTDLIVNENGSVTLTHGEAPLDPLPGSVITAGELNTSTLAEGEIGGQITVLGEHISLLNSTVEASGDNGGGTIRIGGDYQGQGNIPNANHVEIDAASTLKANALTAGNGGQVIVWADHSARFSGEISARGGAQSGNGGFVETSGGQNLTVADTARVDTTAAAGETGTWLLDPANFTVANSGGDISTATLVSNLQTTDQILTATDQITISDIVDASGNTAVAGIGDLTLDAPTVNLNARITLQSGRTLSGTTTNTVNVGAAGSIANGLDVVAAGGTVNLAAATYREGTELTIDQSVNLQGQGASSTIISGDALGDGNSTGNQADNHRVINITNTASNVTISGVTISDGIQTDSAISLGAGLQNRGSNVLITDSTLTQNQVLGANRDGGAIQNRGSLTLLRTTVSNNSANGDGGAIDISNGSVNIIDSVFTNNQTQTAHGGAIDVDLAGSLTVENSSFSNNTAATDGGAIYSQGIVTINNSSILNNTAFSGGGIDNQGGTLTVTNSAITGNISTAPGAATVTEGGGGIRNINGGVLTINQSTVSNNTTGNLGGGILNVSTGSVTTTQISQSTLSGNQSGTRGGGLQSAQNGGSITDTVVSIVDSTISGNYATIDGGGLRVVGPTTLRNVTIANNRSGVSAGGLSDNASTSPAPELLNTLIANNTAPSNPDIEGIFTDRGNNLIGIADGGTGFTLSTLIGTSASPINPLLSALENNGGPTQTHRLLPGSPALDAGSNNGISSIDQRGLARISNGIADIGAIEFDRPSVEITPTINEPNPDIPTDPRVDYPKLNPADEVDNLTALSNNTENDQTNVWDEFTIQLIERSLTEDYTEFWDLPLIQETTLPEIQMMLQQAEQNYATRSAVVYATFIPSDASGTSTQTKADIAQSIMKQEEENENDQLLLMMIPPEGDPIQQLIPVTREEIVQQSKLFRMTVSDPGDDLSYRPLARQLYGWLLEPLETDLQQLGVDNLLYALDRGLRTTPIAAMMDGDSFAIERYGLSIIPSVGLMQSEFQNHASTQETLAAGANTFSTLEALPAVPIELEIIQASAPHTDVLLNEAFTLKNLIEQQQQQNPNTLHLATHAQINPGTPESSYIQFWDEQLTFEEMQALSWQDLELLILSACTTALSSPEAELGFAGLATATGVETSIGSLWNVSDIGTLTLMSELYNQMGDTSLRFQALRNAQVSLLKGNTRIENNHLITGSREFQLPDNLASEQDQGTYEHPFYWAGFTMVGNPWW